MTMARLISVLALAMTGGAGLSAQAPAVNKPRFEVASVKPSAPDAQGQSVRRPPVGGQFFARSRWV